MNEGLVAEAVGLFGRKRRALRLFGTRRREFDWVDRVLARKVATLTGTTLLYEQCAGIYMYFQIGPQISSTSLQAFNPWLHLRSALGAPGMAGKYLGSIIQAAQMAHLLVANCIVFI